MDQDKRNRETQAEQDEKYLKALLKGHDDNPFSVPDNYFRDLPLRIENTIQQAGSTQKKNNQAFILHWLYAVAAVFLLGLLAFFIFLSGEKYNGGKEMISQNNNAGPAVTDTLKLKSTEKSGTIDPKVVLKDTDVIMEETVNQGVNSMNTEEVSKEDIIDYLLEEDIDVNDLTE